MFRYWVLLFIAFVAYTYLVYSNCDAGNARINIPDKDVLKGWKTWQSKNCQSCHQIYGLGGYLGPDLTNETANPNKNEAYIRVFIKYGTGRMPNFHLSDSEVTNVIAFLAWINKSGKNIVPKENVTWSGNYNLHK